MTSTPPAAVPPTAGPPAGFGVRLADACRRQGPLCVGIDPMPSLLRAWDLDDDVAGLERFALGALDALAGHVALVKPQVAFFERHGSAGMAVLERVLAGCRDAGQLCLADAKRGDIGSTAAGYADAWLADGSPLAADAVTASPYLGYGSLRPMLDLAAGTGRGVFVLALTSNPEGASVQHAVPPTRPGTAGAAPASVAAAVAAQASADNDAHARATGERPGPVGLVVGATVGDAVAATGTDLAAVGGHLLAPGVGAQGGSAADLARVFAGATDRVVASVSREVLGAGPGPRALRERCLSLVDQLRAALPG